MAHRSSTRRAMGPICQTASTHPPAGGTWPVRGRRPEVGFRLAMPQKWAGTRTLPAASLPRPNGDPHAAMSAAFYVFLKYAKIYEKRERHLRPR